MADYYPLVAQAVSGLQKSTGEARRALYERARTALVNQLRNNMVPALEESEITRERLALEEAIGKVEAEAARRPPRSTISEADFALSTMAERLEAALRRPSNVAEGARRIAAEEERLRREEETRRKTAEEERLRLEEEARRKAEDEERLRLEEEARRKAEEEGRLRREEEASQRLEEEKRQADDQQRRAAEDDRAEGENEEIRQPSRNPPPAEAIPNPQRRAVQFAGNRDGPIDLVPATLPGEHLRGGVGQREDYVELRAKAVELETLGSNRLGRLRVPVSRFLSLPEDINELRLKLFWSRINTLRIILQDHEQAISIETSNREPDERKLEGTAASLLKDLVKNINVFVFDDPDLMELDAVSVGPQDVEAAREEIRLLTPVLEDLITSSDIATDAAQEVLKEQAENLVANGESTLVQRTAEFGRRSIQNFVGELLRRAYAPVQALSRLTRTEGVSAWRSARDGAYRAIGAGVVAGIGTDLAGVTNFSSSFIRFVAAHADALIAYLTKAFQNPTLIDIVRWIVWLG